MEQLAGGIARAFGSFMPLHACDPRTLAQVLVLGVLLVLRWANNWLLCPMELGGVGDATTGVRGALRSVALRLTRRGGDEPLTQPLITDAALRIACIEWDSGVTMPSSSSG